MNQGPIWGRLLKKTRGRQSRATVPLRSGQKVCSQVIFSQPSEKVSSFPYNLQNIPKDVQPLKLLDFRDAVISY